MDLNQHGRHDCTHHDDMPAWARELWDRVWNLQAHYGSLTARLNRQEHDMATQQDLDNLTAQLTAADQGIQAEIAALQAANPTLDLSGLQAAVQATADLVPAAPAPAEPAPAADPNAPAV